MTKTVVKIKKRVVNYVRQIQGDDGDQNVFQRSLLSTYETYRDFKFRIGKNSYINRVYLRSRSLKRNLSGDGFKFVTVDQASIWTAEWIKTFPHKYDLIVGVPRSGMLIASIIALKLGKPLTTPDLLEEDKYWLSDYVKDQLSLEDARHVLLVDDTVDTGVSMSRALEQIRSTGNNVKVTKAALIIKDEAKSTVDLFHKIIPHPRIFEWNILHRKIASYWGKRGRLAIDMDGVLCEDCPPGVDNDDALYLDWIKNAKPYLIPVFEVDAIVTSRLEMYRQETEQWLREHNVKYGKLCMWDIPSKSHRRGNFARYKINTLLELRPDMFWESRWDQSQKIWKETKIPVLCIDEMTLFS